MRVVERVTLLDGTEMQLRLSVSQGGRRWVRRAGTCRTLGTVFTEGKRWGWVPSPAAFRGDGRPDSEADGDPGDPVPADLIAGAVTVDLRTRGQACEALARYLFEHRAPVLGFGPHSAVGREASCT